MQTFISVLIDLKDFIVQSFLVEKKQHQLSALPASPIKIQPESNLIEDKVISAKEEPLLALVKPTLLSGETGFVSTKTASVFNRSVVSYDGVLKTLKYGTKVSIIGYEGRFARVTFLPNLTGWILKENLYTNEEQIFPKLISGSVYDAANLETIKLRKLIEDEFFATGLFLPLQSEETVDYFLKQKGLVISWSNKRPRLAGTWQQLLRGQLGVSIGITPKAGSIIEYWKENGEGWVGYTKSVMIDESISVLGVGRNNEGEYLEETIDKKTWQEWSPVWIAIS